MNAHFARFRVVVEEPLTNLAQVAEGIAAEEPPFPRASDVLAVESVRIASEICIYTNDNITVEELEIDND